MYDKIVEIICEKCDLTPEEIAEDTYLEDLDVDSLGLLYLAGDLEEAFEMGDIPEEEMEDFRTVNDLVEYVSAHAGSAAKPPERKRRWRK